MTKQIRFVFFLCILCHLWINIAVSQTIANEEDLKKQALKLFDDEEFEEAFSLYSQLTSIYPKDPIYSYRFGVCALYAEEDKEFCITYLEYASKSKEVDKEVFYYLAKAYHLNYRFDDAKKMYQNYKTVASSAKATKLQVDRQIEMCNNGKKLLRNLTDLMVIDKKEMNKTDFFRAYNISAIGGKLLAKPDEKEFTTPADKKKKDKSIIYLSANKNEVFFSSYGVDGKNGKDIYSIKRKDDGEWGEPQPLGTTVNTLFDEDFPFLHPNGKDLFFASKGHNSMGGYDLFKTTYDDATKTWSTPLNLDFPINTPDDDILYVTDLDEKQAYFSSARASAKGKTAVYHINTDRKPIDIVAINGNVLKNREGQKWESKITIKDLNDNSILGIYNSNAEDGSYKLTLPNGGKFLFLVETQGFDTQSEVVVIPVQNQFKPIKQEISYAVGNDKLIVNTIFDGAGDDNNYLSAINFIKEKSKLDVNINDFTQLATPTETIDNTSNEVALSNKLSNNDIIKIAYDDAKEADNEAKELKKQNDIATDYANKKNEIAQEKNNEVKQLFSQASLITDETKKQEALKQANEENKIAEELNNESVAAYNLSKKIEFVAESKQKEADLAIQYAKDLESAVNSKNSTQALAKLDEQQKKLEALNKENANSIPIIKLINTESESKKRELDKAIQTSNDIKQEMSDNDLVMNNLKADLAKTKNDAVKNGINNQMEELKKDNIEKQNELAKNEIKVSQLNKEYKGIANEKEIIAAVEQQVKTGGTELVINNTTKENKTIVSNNNSTIAINNKTIEKTQTNNTEEKENNKAKETKASNNNVPLVNKQDIIVTNKKDSIITPEVKKDLMAENDKTVNEAKKNEETLEKKTETNSKTETVKDSIITKKKENETNIGNQEEVKKDSIKINETITSNTKTKTTEFNKDSVSKSNSNEVTKENKEQKNTVIEKATISSKANDTIINQNIVSESKENISSVVDYSLNYSTEIKNTDTIANAKDKEIKKTEIYTQWVNTISKELTEKQNELKTEKNKEKKKDLSQSISNLENELKRKQELVTVSIANTDKLKNESIANSKPVNEPITTSTLTPQKSIETKNETSAPVNTNVTYETKYDNEITSADSIPNPKQRELKKAEIYNKWALSISEELNVKRQELAEEKDKKEINELNKQIALLENDYASKKAIAAITLANAPKAKQQKINETKTESADIVKNVDTLFTKQEQAKSTTLPEKIDVTKVDSKTKEAKYQYSSALSKEQQNKTNALLSESAQLEKESSSKKSQANSETDETKKSILLAEANKLEKQSSEKKTEAATSKALANKTEYSSNENELEKYNSLNNSDADEISVAEMMRDESKIYFDKAEKSRQKAEEATEGFYKESLLNEANSNELVALEKQKKAIDTYKAFSKKVPVVTNAKKQNIQTPPKPKETITNTIANNKTNKTETIIPKKDTTAVVAKELKSKDNSISENKINKDENKSIPVISSEKLNTTNDAKSINKLEEENKSTVAATNKNTKTENKKRENSSEKNITTLPTLIGEKDMFKRTNVPAYSVNKPIPVNEKLPEGLVFKVQIGAFQNPIPQNLFTGISPITGESTKQGFTRYTAGLFSKYSTADNVKNEIRSLGYKDAFVVAFLNGIRIPISQALSMTGESAATVTGNSVSPNNNTSNQTESSSNNTTIKEKEVPVVNKTQDISVAVAEKVETIGGLFYTIQVGVYSQPVSSAKLYNVNPLYTETTVNGYLRYTTGIYDNLVKANEAKNSAINAGIKDAFVVVYYQGKRISLAEAAQLIALKKVEYSNSVVLNKLPQFGNANSDNSLSTSVIQKSNNNVINNNKSVTEKETKKDNPTNKQNKLVEFKVQIGAFKDEVPIEIANKFLKIAAKGVNNYKDENGLTIYTVGNYNSYEEATKTKTEIATELAGAFVVAYFNGKKISIEEANSLKGK